MSRLIIKNLPNKVTVDQLKDVFSEKGEVTDVQLKYTKDGKFRNFGFIGYRTEEQANAAKEYFDGTCIRSMKIQVETCANLGDDKKPRAWSKYAPDSTAYKKLHQNEVSEKTKQKKEKKVEKNKNKIKELLKKHKDDPLFAEFIEAHINERTSWIKDVFEEASKSDDDSGVEEENTEQNTKEVLEPHIKDNEGIVKEKVANKQISDLEYMKLLMKRVDGVPISEENIPVEEQEPKKIRNRPLFYIKITGLPYKCKKKDIKEFFKPLVPFSIRLPLGKGKKLAGFCYVGFRTEKEFKKALDKDKLFLGNHRIHIHKYENKAKQEVEKQEEQNNKYKQQQTNNEESIGESGSIFVRNLPYVVSEAEVTTLFEKYGPLAEVNMPIDTLLRQPKGFATVTFMIPEHAVKAYTELDGTTFCGRMLHLLPAKTEKIEADSDNEGLSFKEKKAKKIKSQAKSSHNWNVLFLGANAVADVIAANYNTTKDQLLNDNNTNTSAAVRLALGETQLVAETRTFLENNGVYLDAFNKPAKKRSNTCILVKNLPADTDKNNIQALFEKHGQIARFLMPKHGITALVDFIEPFEAKKAFTNLAYSQYKSAPLYLEWAPENVFLKSTRSSENDTKHTNKNNENENKSQVEENRKENTNNKIKEDLKSVINDSEKIEENDIKEEINDLIEPENDTTLFVKNLNFKTNEDALKRHFSSYGKLHNVTIAKKKDPKNSGQFLSMGYGFVQYYRKEHANEALKLLQYSDLDGKTLELKRSERGNTYRAEGSQWPAARTKLNPFCNMLVIVHCADPYSLERDKGTEVRTARKTNKETSQNGTKILVRNVPFQANRQELHEIFRAFGEIKTLRLPKKLTPGSDQHRGFAFVDYHTKADAKSAFEALCQSTHLYGRRLVLEWADQSDENEDINLLRKRTAQAFNAKAIGGKKSKKAAIDAEKFVDGEQDEV